MHSIREDMDEFRRQLRNGSIQKAYYALLSYMMGLRTHFQKKYPGYALNCFTVVAHEGPVFKRHFAPMMRNNFVGEQG